MQQNKLSELWMNGMPSIYNGLPLPTSKGGTMSNGKRCVCVSRLYKNAY
jgi:hypothetical protein